MKEQTKQVLIFERVYDLAVKLRPLVYGDNDLTTFLSDSLMVSLINGASNHSEETKKILEEELSKIKEMPYENK